MKPRLDILPSQQAKSADSLIRSLPFLARVPAAVREALIRESANVKSVHPFKKLASTIGISS
jgi:hypothetical protein